MLSQPLFVIAGEIVQRPQRGIAVALNSDKDVYKPGETITVGFAVVTTPDGLPVCNVTAYGRVETPSGKTFEIPEENIAVSKTCAPGPEGPTDLADYAFFLKPEEEGIHTIVLTVVFGNDIATVFKKVQVLKNPKFQITREGATRTWTGAMYHVPITIKSEDGFFGTVKEIIPNGYIIDRISEGGYEEFKDDKRYLVWSDVEIDKGGEKTLAYIFKPPERVGTIERFGPIEMNGVTKNDSSGIFKKTLSYFGILTDQSVSDNKVYESVYVEDREWQVASDADGSGTATVDVSAVDPSSTQNTLTFSITGTNLTYGGEVSVTVPNGWTTPQNTSGNAGYSTTTVSVMPTTAGTTTAVLLNPNDSLTAPHTISENGTFDFCGTSATVSDPVISTATKIQGSGSVQCRDISAGTGSSNGDDLQWDMGSNQNWTGYTWISFWMRTANTFTAATPRLDFVYDDTAALASPLQSFTMPGAWTANQWRYIKVNLTGTRSSVRYYGLQCTNNTCSFIDNATDFFVDFFQLGPGVPYYKTVGSDTEIRVPVMALSPTDTLYVYYGYGGGASGATAPSTPGSYQFTVKTAEHTNTATGTLTSIASSPSVSVAGITVSGVLYSDEGVTVETGSKNIYIRPVSSSTPGLYLTTNNGSGVWTATVPGVRRVGVPIHIWVDGDSNYRSFTLTKSSSSVNNITNVPLYKNRILLKHEGTMTSTSTTIADLALYDSDNDPDIQFTANNSTLSVATGQKLLVASSTRFNPEGAITTHANQDSAPSGDLGLGWNSILYSGGLLTISGSLLANTASSTIVDSSSNGILFRATTTGKFISGATTTSMTFSSTTFNGSGGGWTFTNWATTTQDFLITNGNVTAPWNSLTLLGNYSNAGTFTHASGTVYFASTSAPGGAWSGSSFDTAGSGNASPVGIATYNGFFWVVDSVDDAVYKYNLDGSYTGTSFDTAASGNGNPYGIAFFNDHFWITDSFDAEVYKYRLDGTYTGSSFDTSGSGNGSPYGITYFDNYIWITDGVDAEVYKYNLDGSYTGTSFDTAASGNGASYGIVYSNGFFWVTDITDDLVYKYSAPGGTFTNTTFSTSGSGNADGYGIAFYNGFFWVTDITDGEVYKYIYGQGLSGTMTGASAFNNLVFSNSGAKSIANNASTSDFNIATTSGEVVAPNLLTITGNYTNSAADFNSNSGTVYFASTSGSQILSGYMTASSSWSTLSFSGAATKALVSNASTTNFVINSGSGRVTAPSLLSISGNYTNNQSFNHNFGTVYFDSLISTTSLSHTAASSSFDTSGSGSDTPYNIVGYDGYLWILDTTDDIVYKFDLNGTYTGTSFNTTGVNGDPYAITAYNGFLWITDNTDAEVYKYNLDGSYTGTSFDTNSSGNTSPFGIVGYNDYFWITDSSDIKVYKYNLDGSYTGTSFDTSAVGNSTPIGITVYNNYFWIIDAVSAKVFKYDLNGSDTGVSFSTSISGNGTPRGITAYNGYFWITDLTDDLVYKYTAGQGISGTLTGASAFNNVVFSSSSGKDFANNASTSSFTIDSTSGKVRAPNLLTISGDYTNNSTFDHNSGTIYFATTSTRITGANQSISGFATGTNRFNNLIFAGTGTTTFSANASTSNFTIVAGDTFVKLNTSSSCLPAGSSYYDPAFSSDGTYLAIPHGTSPYITICKRSGDTFTKLSDPSSLPASTGQSAAFSPDGNYLVVGHNTTPFITIYKRTGDTFTKLPDPASLPAENPDGADFSPDGKYLALGHSSSPYITIYRRDGDTFTKLSNPASLPTFTGFGVKFSSDGLYLAIAHFSSPYVTIYKRSGDTFTKLDNPVSLPASTGVSVSFSPGATYLAVGHSSSPYITIYKRSGDTFTKLSDPTDLPPGTTGYGVNFSPDGSHLVVGNSNSPYITIYKRSGDTFTKLDDPATLPGSQVFGSEFSPDGTYLALTHNSSPYVSVYKRSSSVVLPTDLLTISGNLTNYGGSMDWEGGTIFMDSSSAQTIDGVFRGASNIGNIRLTGGSTKTMAGNIASSTLELNDLTIDSGNTLVTWPYDLRVYGDFTNNGTFTKSTNGTTTLAGTSTTQYLSGNLTGTSALGNVIHDSATTTQTSAVFNFIEPVDVSLSGFQTGNWYDRDVSSYVPAGATGVILHIETTANDQFGIRKNGSTDDRYRYGYGGQHLWAMVGVDSSRIFEAKIANINVDMWLVGYTTDGATFFTNSVDKSLSGTDAWTDIDISSDTGSDTAIGAIIEYYDTNGVGDYGLRKNGSTDARIRRTLGHGWAIVGVDSSEILEGYITDLGDDFHLVGYVTEGAVFKTNADDISLGSTGAYSTIDLTSYTGSDIVTGAFIETYSSVAGSGNNYALRKFGSSEDIYKKSYEHAWAFVEADSSKQIEGKISSTNEDFFLIGYATSTVALNPTHVYSSNASTSNFIIENGDVTLPSLLSISGYATSSPGVLMGAGTGTVYLNGSATQTWFSSSTGSSAFYNLTVLNTSGSDAQTSPSAIFLSPITVLGTFTASSSNSKIQFAAGLTSTTTINHLMLDGQDTSTRVALRSTVSGTQFGLSVSGTRFVQNTDVKDSNACSGYSDIDASHSSNYDSSNNRCWTFPVGAQLTLSSASNQLFAIGDGVTSISTLTVTEGATPSLTLNNGLRIAIATSSIGMLWYTPDTTATFGGTASGKVSNPVSYEGGGSVLVVPIGTSFSASDVLTISGLSFTSFSSTTNAMSGLKIFSGGSEDQTGDANDDKTITIKGLLTKAPSSVGQTSNKFDTTSASITNTELYAFRLTPTGENVTVTNLVLNLSDIRGVVTGDVTNVGMFLDYDSNGVVDAHDLQVGGAGSPSISDSSGTITFSTSFTATTSRNYLIRGSVASIDGNDEMNISLGSITATGATSVVSITPNGSLTSLAHRKVTALRGGRELGDDAAASQGDVGGGGAGGGQVIGDEPGFKAPTALGSTFSEFTNASNAYSSDGSYATDSTSYHRQDYRDFTFNVPSGNTINGFEVKVEAKASTAAGTISAALSWDGGTGTTTPDKTTSTLTTSDVVYTLGSPSDTWGRSWSVSETNDTNFRLRLAVNPSGGNTISIDAIQVRVYYQVSGGSSGGGQEVYIPRPTFESMFASVWNSISNLISKLSLSF